MGPESMLLTSSTPYNHVHICACVHMHMYTYIHTYNYFHLGTSHVVPAVSLTPSWISEILEPFVSNNCSDWRWPNEMPPLGLRSSSGSSLRLIPTGLHREREWENPRVQLIPIDPTCPSEHHCPKRDLCKAQALTVNIIHWVWSWLAMWLWARHSASVSTSVKWT